MRRLSWFLVLLMLGAAAGTAVAHPGAAIAVGADGRVFFVDTGGGVFSLDRNSRVTRLPGPAFHWFAFDPAGRFARTPWPSISGADFQAAGTNPTLILSSDYPVTIGTDGKFYLPQPNRSGRVQIIAIDPSGARTVKATLPPITSEGRPAIWLNGIAAGPNGSLYYTEDRAVKKIDAQGRVSVVADNVAVAGCVAIPGVEATQRPYLRGLSVARDGTVYVAASGCGAVLRIDASGRSTPVLRTASPWSPTDVAVAGSDVYVLEYSHTASDDRREWLPRVRKLAANGAVTTLGGSNRR